MFEPGKKYMFSRTAFWNDNGESHPKATTDAWWVNLFDGHIFVGLGRATQAIEKGEHRIIVIPEWCIDGEVELI